MISRALHVCAGISFETGNNKYTATKAGATISLTRDGVAPDGSAVEAKYRIS
jgi:hypothetical protein